MGIPLTEPLPYFNLLTILNKELGSVDNGVFPFLPAFWIDNSNAPIPVHDNRETFPVSHCVDIYELDDPGILTFKNCPFHYSRSSATNMECSHGKLRARFTNRLSRNNTYSFTYLSSFTPREIPAVTLCTNTMF